MDHKRTLLVTLKEEQEHKIKGGIYHKLQIEFTYNSNHIEGSRLSQEQTRSIFETNTVFGTKEVIHLDDVTETSNHFRCIDRIIQTAESELTETLIKELHFLLRSGTSDSRIDWFVLGDYKKLPNEVGGTETSLIVSFSIALM